MSHNKLQIEGFTILQWLLVSMPLPSGMVYKTLLAQAHMSSSKRLCPMPDTL